MFSNVAKTCIPGVDQHNTGTIGNLLSFIVQVPMFWHNIFKYSTIKQEQRSKK
jgi:hypothetical protein